MLDLKKRIASHISGLLGAVAEEDVLPLLEYPPNPEMGDLSLPCFRFSKLLRQSPQSIADGLRGKLSDPAIARADSVAGYLNLFLDKGRLADSVLNRILAEGDRYGATAIGEGRTIVIDYSSPNIAKPFHVAHLRSTVIGGALYRIFEFMGYHCVGVNHLGDWGTQFGKLIVAFRNWGSDESVERGGIDELLRLYVKFHEEAEKSPQLEDEARGWFVRLEAGDEEALALWRRFVEISLAEFDNIYRLLGVRFDAYTGESFYNDKTASVIRELKEKALLEEDQGALLIRLEAYGMAPALMVKKDGSSLYHTRDVAAALYRKRHYHFDKAIYVTDYAQNLHFQQWFKIVELMGCDWAKDLIHVAFGRVSIEGVALSTRKGNVIKLDELLQQAIRKTRAIIEERNPELPDKDTVARQVGVGAVIFNDLSGNRIKDINFTWEDALNFEGETGPYVQYTYARACSILRKAGMASGTFDGGLLQNPEAADVVKRLAQFPETVIQAMDKLEPSIVTRYIVDLAQSFNRFYHECKVMVDDAELRRARLALVDCVRIALGRGLGLIGLETPEHI